MRRGRLQREENVSRAHSDAPPPVHHELAPGSRFGRYDIVRRIGTGGMGSVFEATHTLLKKPVALKTMHTGFARSEAARLRFLREAETVARIRHPNVVDISDVGVEQDIPYLVMELLDGEDLARMLHRQGPLTQTEAVDAVLPIACGLAAAHRLGIVHRDVKPENVLLSRAGNQVTPKLIDFGVSKDLDRSTIGEGYSNTVTGTPQYMAPEQARGASLDGRTDEYALGVMLYQCLSGRLPYESPSLLELVQLIDGGIFRPLREIRPDLDPALCAIIEKAMARAPRDRFPSVDAFGHALLPYANERLQLLYESELNELVTPPSLAPEVDRFASMQTVPSAATRSGVRERDLEPQAPSPARKSYLRPMAILVALLAVSAGAWWLQAVAGSKPVSAPIASSPSSAASLFRVRIRVTPDDAEIALDGAPVAVGSLDRELTRDGAVHTLQISRAGYEPRILILRDRAPASDHITLQRVSANFPEEARPRVSPQAKRAPPKPQAEPAEPVVPTEPEPPEPLDIQMAR
jgi:serine/threonine-protein kinase